jgi:hypothetical protein
MRDASLNIMRVEPPVYGHRYGKGFDKLVCILTKPSSPGLAGSGGRPEIPFRRSH